MKIQVSESDISEIMKEFPGEKVTTTLDKLIKFLRHLEEEKIKDKIQVGGIDELKDLVQNNYIKMDLYLKILPLIEDHKKNYEITQK